MNDIANAYLATWNATDEAQRAELLNQHWSSTVTYTDPLAEVSGRDGVSAVIAAAQQQFAGWTFSRYGDVIVFDEDNRICDVRGFLDRVPA